MPELLRRGRLLGLCSIAAIVWALALPGAPPLSADGASEFRVQLVRVHTPTHDHKNELSALGLDLTEHGGEDFVDVVLHSTADVATLVENGFSYEVEVPDLAARFAANRSADRTYAATVATSLLPSGRTSYRHLADYEAELQGLANDNSGLVRLLTLPHKSLEGRDILGVEISDDVESETDGKPVFLMMGLHHAREWPSGEHSMEFAIDLVNGYKTADARITDLLKRTRVIVVPVVNPDGFEQSRKWGDIVDLREEDPETGWLTTPGNAYKRKNCRAVDGVNQQTTGACEVTSPGGLGLGIDLNRNYGGLWGGAGASPAFAHATYRGPSPFSEPETQNVRELISGRHVTTLITNHTYSNLVLRPPGIRKTGTTVDETAMKDLGARMASNNGYRNIHGWQLYDTSGTTEDWSYATTGGYGYTFEIGPHEFHPPFVEAVNEYVGTGFYTGKGNREAYLLALENAANAQHHSLLGGKAPAGAVLRLKKVFETKTSGPITGPLSITDTLESTLTVPSNDRFTWHVNPSTRPEVMEHRVKVLADEPTREETTTKNVVWAPGDHVDVPFSMPESGVGALKVNLDWPTPDDLDLYVYYVQPDGSLLEVGSSGEFVVFKEEAIIDLPDPGNYVIRAKNYASVSPTFTVTAGLYGVAREDVSGGNLVESYTLTCEKPDGTVLEKVDVTVDRGRSQRLDLKECSRRFRREA